MTATCFVSTLCDALWIRLAVAALAGNGHAAQRGGAAHQHAHHGSQLAGISRLGHVGLGFFRHHRLLSGLGGLAGKARRAVLSDWEKDDDYRRIQWLRHTAAGA